MSETRYRDTRIYRSAEKFRNGLVRLMFLYKMLTCCICWENHKNLWSMCFKSIRYWKGNEFI